MTDKVRVKRCTTAATPTMAIGCSSPGSGRAASARQHAHVDEWCKDVGPSTQLRTWFGHEPERFPEFADRYRAELADSRRRWRTSRRWRASTRG